MFGDLTRVGANFHAMEAWSNLKKVNGDIGAEALIGLVLVRKENDLIKLVREVPPEIKNTFLLLEEGPKN